MTLFFMLNPKQFVLGTDASGDGDPYRKRRTPEIEKVEEIVESIVPEKIEGSTKIKDPTINKEIQAKVGEYLVLSRQIEEAKEEQARVEMKARQEIIAKKILEMQEEEEAVIMLLLN